MKDMKQEQDDLSNVRLKLEQELQIINDEKNTLLRQLSYSQVVVYILSSPPL